MADLSKFSLSPCYTVLGELRNKALNKCIDTNFKQSNQRFGLQQCTSDNSKIAGEQVC